MNDHPRFRDDVTLAQMRESAIAIRDFCQGLTYDAFEQDIKVWSATAYQILAIGEAAHRISAEFAARYSDIPWQEMMAMRHILAHGYDILRLDILWQTATQDIPLLRARIEQIMASGGTEDAELA